MNLKGGLYQKEKASPVMWHFFRMLKTRHRSILKVITKLFLFRSIKNSLFFRQRTFTFLFSFRFIFVSAWAQIKVVSRFAWPSHCEISARSIPSWNRCYWQAMHSYIRIRNPLISAKVEMRGFCLLRRCPNPRRTLKVCSGNAGNFQRLRDFANR